MKLIIQGADEVLNVYRCSTFNNYEHIPRICEIVKINGKRFKVVDVELELSGNEILKYSDINIYLESND